MKKPTLQEWLKEQVEKFAKKSVNPKPKFFFCNLEDLEFYKRLFNDEKFLELDEIGVEK